MEIVRNPAGKARAGLVKAAGISAAFAATVFRPKVTRAPQPDDVRQAQGGYAQAQKVATQSAPPSRELAESARGSSKPGSAINLQA
jgi:hypothetical protein